MHIIAIPFVGWVLGPIFAALTAIPFYVLWHVFNVNKFFTFLPDVYINASFWEIVGFFLIASMLKSILLPTFTCNCKCDK